MEKQIFTNEVILSWLQYYAKNTTIDLEHVKIIDITKKNKNVIPTVESHKTTMVFTNAGIDDIFYRLWNAGLGECEVWVVFMQLLPLATRWYTVSLRC